MAYISDLRFINGQWVDTTTPDYLFGTQSGDTINVYAGDNAVSALGGNDTIFEVRSYSGGYSGADKVYGGEGNDLIVSSLDGAGNYYSGDAGTDTLNLIPNSHGVYVDLAAHIARDRSTGATSQVWTIENVTGTGMNDYLYGDANGNTLTGYNGDDLIRGQGGRDLLNGGNGQDVLFGGNHNDYVNGNAGNDILYGEAANDQLFGELGTDTLVGGIGKDYMVGGANADTFKFTSLADSGVTGATADMIADFVHLLDKINVADIDARATQAGNQAFTFIGNNNFTAAGQIRYVLDAASQDTVILLNTDNDSAAEMIIKIDPLVALSAGDFVL